MSGREPAGPWEREITRAARNVARLQSTARQFRKRLRDTDRELRAAKKILRRLVTSLSTEQSAPSHARPGVRLPIGGGK